MGILDKEIKKIVDKDKIMEYLLGKVQYLKGDKGDMPIAGEHYPIPKNGIDGDPGYTPQKGIDYFDGQDGKSIDEKKVIQEIIKKLPISKNGRPGRDGKSIKGKDGLDGSPDTPEQIKEKIKKLPVREKWFDYNHIKNVPIDLSGKKRLGRGTGSTVQYSDLTSQCNGSTKTFTIPANNRVLGVFGTQFPIAYRPITDWTSSGTILTLTSEVSAPSSGQTLFIFYVEN